MSYLGILLVIGGAVSLPFLLTDDPRRRERLYLPLSAAPALSVALFASLGFNGYAVWLLAVVFTLPLSLALIAVGVALIVSAASAGRGLRSLTSGILLAGSPFLFAVVLMIYKLILG